MYRFIRAFLFSYAGCHSTWYAWERLIFFGVEPLMVVVAL